MVGLTTVITSMALPSVLPLLRASPLEYHLYRLIDPAMGPQVPFYPFLKDLTSTNKRAFGCIGISFQPYGPSLAKAVTVLFSYAIALV
jgi:hypothetical protein